MAVLDVLGAFAKAKINPAVAIVGPRGSGKSIYRSWVHLNQGDLALPPALRSILGLAPKEALIGRLWGLQYSDDKESRGWRVNEDGLTRYATQQGDHGKFLREEASSTYLQFQDLHPPRDAAQRTRLCVLDYPGEFFTIAEANRDNGYYAEFEAHHMQILRQCGMVHLTLPFWYIIPRSLRRGPTEVDIHWGRVHRKSTPDVEEDRVANDRRLRAGTQDWLNRIDSLMAGPRRPTLVVILTMLDSEWHQELLPPGQCPSPESSAILEGFRTRLARLRALIKHPLASAHTDAAPGAPGDAGWATDEARAPWWRSAVKEHLRQAAYQHLLVSVHEQTAALLRMAARAAGELHDDQLHQEIARILGLLDHSGRDRVRCLAMNIVNRRHVRVHGNDTLKHHTFMRIEQAGAILPTALLAGSIDSL